MDIALSLSWEAQQSAVACARLLLVLATLEPLFVPETGVFGTLQFALFSVSALAKHWSCCDPSHKMDREICLDLPYDDSIYKYYKIN